MDVVGTPGGACETETEGGWQGAVGGCDGPVRQHRLVGRTVVTVVQAQQTGRRDQQAIGNGPGGGAGRGTLVGKQRATGQNPVAARNHRVVVEHRAGADRVRIARTPGDRGIRDGCIAVGDRSGRAAQGHLEGIGRGVHIGDGVTARHRRSGRRHRARGHTERGHRAGQGYLEGIAADAGDVVLTGNGDNARGAGSTRHGPGRRRQADLKGVGTGVGNGVGPCHTEGTSR